MANKNGYYTEGKYSCNHPESDFVSNSKGPIEIKREKNFVEYTHRNETANMRYDVWETPRTTDYYASRNSYNKNTSKKSNLNIIWILLFIYVGLPIIFSIFGAILDAIF